MMIPWQKHEQVHCSSGFIELLDFVRLSLYMHVQINLGFVSPLVRMSGVTKLASVRPSEATVSTTVTYVITTD